MSAETPTSFGRYEVLERIGGGGFGEVYAAHDPKLGRKVAIKTCTSQDAEHLRRFEQEAALSASLDHRNLTATFDYADEAPVPYLVQEYLDGEDLDQKISRREELSHTNRLQYLIQLARGLSHAHSRRVIHRDVKPSNVRVLPSGQVKLMDFGSAKSLDDEPGDTIRGETMGTAAYLAPEQIRGEALDQRCDIYGFGVTAHELLTYERPFPGDDADAVLQSILQGERVPIEQSWDECPPSLAALIDRCLAVQRKDRYESFYEVLRDFDSILGQDASQREASEQSALETETEDPESTVLLDQPTLLLEPDQRPNAPPARAAQRAAPPAKRSPAAAPPPAMQTPAEKGPSLARLLVVLLVMGLFGALAASLFFSQEQEPSAPARQASPIPPESARNSGGDTGAAQTPDREEPQATRPSAGQQAGNESQATPSQQGGTTAAVTQSGTLSFPAAWDPRTVVRVAGRTVPLDQARELNLPAGRHSVRFRLADDPDTGWNESQSQSIQVRVTEGESIEVANPLQAPGLVTVRAALGARQAFVRLDGDPMGWTPLADRLLPPGSYVLSGATTATQEPAERSFPITVNGGEELLIVFDVSNDAPPTTNRKEWSP